jgi:hypothetical protein
LKRIFLFVFLLLIIIAGCTPVVPTATTSNANPVSYIDTVSLKSAVVGTKISFEGHGTDPDGNIVGYEWRSSIDGIISNKSSFNTADLSVGKHAIYFRVQDNKNIWSTEKYIFIEIIAGYTTNPVIDSFKVTPIKISTGESAVLTWDVSSATRVSIAPGIGDVAASGTRILYPSADTTYTITASNSNGQTQGSVNIAVVQDKVRTVELYAIASECGSVRLDGLTDTTPKVGVIGAGLVWEAFFSFDISAIPMGATIKSTTLDLTNNSIIGSPFGLLGGMGIIQTSYTNINAKNYVTTFPVRALYVAYTQPLQPYTFTTISDAVQSQVSKDEDRFQIRLQFERYYYHEEDPNHQLSFIPANASKLSVTYELP